jgi:hypothetical protein
MLSEQEKEARRKRLARMEWADRAAWLVGAMIVLITLALAIWLSGRNPKAMFNDPRIAAMCKMDYATARTAAESVGVDQLEPTVDRESAPLHISCGDIRRGGGLR